MCILQRRNIMKRTWLTRAAAAASIAAVLASGYPLSALAETAGYQEETAADTTELQESETESEENAASAEETETETETESETETEAEVHQITGFAGLAESEKEYTVSYYNKPSEDEVIAMLPDTIEVYLDNQSVTTEIPVTWENPVSDSDYSSTDYFYYEYDAVWDTDQYTLATDQEAPYVWVNLSTALGEGETEVGSSNVSGGSQSAVASVFRGRIATGSNLLLAAASASTQDSNQQAIYNYLTQKMGFNTAAACGILSNIEAESAFYPTLYGDGGTSYGLCQWHNDRFTALKNYTSNYQTVEGQMSYLYHELQTSYSGVLNYLRNVSNNASGAYDAGYYWCYYFEIPANRTKAAQVRGNRASEHFWPQYSGQATNGSTDGGDTTVSSLQISGATKPTSLTEGSGFSVQGTISSNTRITQVTAGVYDASGNRVIGAEASPYTTMYTLGNMDASIRFGTLSAGTYTYKVIATDEKETKTLVETQFTVTGSGSGTSQSSGLRITGQNHPDDLTTGQGFSIKGVVTSDKTITNVTVGVYDASGNQLIGASASPNSKSFDLYSLDTRVRFGTLSAGIYVYKVTAEDQDGPQTLVEAYFTETAANNATVSSLSISNYSQPTTIQEGSGFSVRGTITSSSKIKRASVNIVDDSGDQVISASASPNTSTYNISGLDSKVRFGTLSTGEYTYQVTAEDAGGQETLVNDDFSVVGGEVKGLEIANAVNPDSFTAGTVFTIGGSISSGSKISNVTAAVYNGSGSKVLSASMNPNSTSCELSSLAGKLQFETLSAGTYTYAVNATDQTGTQALVNVKFTVKEADACISIADYTAPTSLTVGDYFVVRGNVTSDSRLTNVTVGVYDSNGKQVIGASATPNKKTYSLSGLDWKVKFGKLSAGSYVYRVTASNKNGTKTLVEQNFTESVSKVGLKLTSYTKPTELTTGNYFILRGIVTSGSTIKSVTAAVYDEDGKQVIGYTAHPNSRSYSLASLDTKVKFGKLSAGTYSYRVIAEDENGTTTLLDQTFTEKDPSGSLKLTSYTKPISLHVGNGFSVQGRVSSGSKLKEVTVGVYTEDGTKVIGCTAHPTINWYYLENMDHRIKFGKLKKGTYYYRVTATDQNGTVTLLNAKFTEK